MSQLRQNKLKATFDLLEEQDKQISQQHKYATDPIAWVAAAFGSQYVPVVDKIRRSVEQMMEHRLNLIYGVNASGKSFCYDALISLWWIFGRGKDNAQFIILAGSSQQTTKAFGYMAQMIEVNHERHAKGLTQIFIDGRVVQEVKLRVGGITVGFGRNPRQGENNKQAILGGHSLGDTLMICEEADGLSDVLMLAAQRNATAKGDIVVAITNPNDPDSYVGRQARWYEDTLDGKDVEEEEKNQWHITQIGWVDMPTNPDSDTFNEDIPAIQFDNLLQPDWVNQMSRDYGSDPAMYNTLVLGRFDYVNKKSLITKQDINTGIETQAALTAETVSRPVMGLDLALFGSDNTVAYIAYDIPTPVMQHSDNVVEGEYGEDIHQCDDRCREITKTITYCRFLSDIQTNDVDQVEQARWVGDMCEKHNISHVHFDSANMGAAFERTLTDELTNRKLDTICVGFSGARRDFAGARYNNDRSYWWGTAKERLHNGDIDLDATDETLVKELMMLGFHRDAADRVCLESKDKLVKSPDYADAFVYAVTPRTDVEYMLNQHTKEPEKIIEMADYDEDFQDDFYDRFGIGDPFAGVRL
jgi:hypothetical protein